MCKVMSNVGTYSLSLVTKARTCEWMVSLGSRARSYMKFSIVPDLIEPMFEQAVTVTDVD